MNNCRLEGKVALITGGASGIGGCSAKLSVRHSAKVVIADIQDDLGNSVYEEIDNREPVSYVHCDVTRESDVEKAVDTAVSKFGKLDMLFSNAGTFGNPDLRASAIDYENLSIEPRMLQG